MYTYICFYKYTFSHTHIYIYICTYICIHTYIHIYMHIYTHNYALTTLSKGQSSQKRDTTSSPPCIPCICIYVKRIKRFKYTCVYVYMYIFTGNHRNRSGQTRSEVPLTVKVDYFVNCYVHMYGLY